MAEGEERREDDPHPLWRRRARAARLRARRRASALSRRLAGGAGTHQVGPRQADRGAGGPAGASARRRAVVQRIRTAAFDAKTWFGAFAPAGTPKARVEELGRHLAAVIKSQVFQERFIKLGGYDAVGDTPEEFRTFLAEDRARGEALVKLSGVKIEQ